MRAYLWEASGLGFDHPAMMAANALLTTLDDLLQHEHLEPRKASSLFGKALWVRPEQASRRPALQVVP